MKRLVLCAILSFISLNLFSQELKVKEFYKDDSAIDAIKFQVKDANGDPTALIKVGLTVGDAIFEGDILKVSIRMVSIGYMWWMVPVGLTLRPRDTCR